MQKEHRKRAIAYYNGSGPEEDMRGMEGVRRQRAAVEKYARQESMSIIHQEWDDGSTSNVDRPGFSRMFETLIRNPNAPSFDYILVLDEIRWGRFQNDKESEYYKYQCLECNKQVVCIKDRPLYVKASLLKNLFTIFKEGSEIANSRRRGLLIRQGLRKKGLASPRKGAPPRSRYRRQIEKVKDKFLKLNGGLETQEKESLTSLKNILISQLTP